MTNHPLSRRVAIAGLCAAAAIPAARASAGAADPVFAAIKAYRDGYAHHRACLDKADAIEEVIFEKWRAFDANFETANDIRREAVEQLLPAIRKTSPNATEAQLFATIRHTGRQMIEQENGAEEMARLRKEGVDAECDAERALFATVPTTAAGAAAMLQVIREGAQNQTSIIDSLSEPDQVSELLLSIETFLRRQVQS